MSANTRIWIILIVFFSLGWSKANGQESDTVSAHIVFNNGDELDARLVNSYRGSRLKTFANGGLETIPLRSIRQFSVNNETTFVTVKLSLLSGVRSYKLKTDGPVQIIERKGIDYIRLREYNYLEPLNTRRMHRKAARFVSDYPLKFPQTELKLDIDSCLNVYNTWKEANLISESYLESKIHKWNLLTARLSLLAPSVGLEISMSERMTVLIEGGINRIVSTNPDLFVGGYVDASLRCYVNQVRRRNRLLWTGYHSAEYFSVGMGAYSFDGGNIYQLTNLKIGTQRAWYHLLTDMYVAFGADVTNEYFFFFGGVKLGLAL